MNSMLFLLKSQPFSDAVAIIRKNRIRDEEVFQANDEFRKKFINEMADRAAFSCESDSHAARLVMVALLAAGYNVDLYTFGELIGNLMLIAEGESVAQEKIDNLIDKVMTFDGKEEASED